MTAKTRTAILISGRGSNMQSLVEAASAKDFPAEIVSVISSRPEAPGLTWAATNNIPAIVVDHTSFASRGAFEERLQTTLLDAGAELVALAGFMRLMTPGFVEKWHNRMVNIHPSLLPSFKGLHTHEQALAAGVKITGCTVHFVRPEMDTGPIIAQAAVPVLSGDTAEILAGRVLAAEHRLYPMAMRLVASGRIRVVAEKTIMLQEVNESLPLFSPSG